jgi:hypothetical protein
MRSINSGENNSLWIFFSMTLFLLLFTDYLPVMMILVFLFYLLYKEKSKGVWSKFVLSLLPLVIIGIFWLPIFQRQSENGRWLLATVPGWKDVAGGANLKQIILLWMKFTFGRISLENKIPYYILVILTSIPFLFSIFAFIKSKYYKRTIIGMWFILPLLLGFIISYFIPAFIYFRFLFIYPAFVIIVSLGIFACKSDFLRKILVTSILTINIFSLAFYLLSKNQQREDWRSAVRFVENSIKNNEIVVFEYPEPFAPYRWYERKPDLSFGLTDSIYASDNKTTLLTIETINDKSGLYYFEYLRDLSDPNRIVEKVIKDHDFTASAVYNFNGIGQVYYFSRGVN